MTYTEPTQTQLDDAWYSGFVSVVVAQLKVMPLAERYKFVQDKLAKAKAAGKDTDKLLGWIKAKIPITAS